MNVPEPGSEGGWNVAKVLGFIVGLVGMVGFGVCGLCGLTLSLGGGLGPSSSDMGFVLVLSFGGLAIATAFFFLVRAMVRSARRRPPPGPSSS